MKCKVCREHAVVDIRRHNAGFCRDHFLEHARNQVARAIKEFKMFRPDDRLLLAVSGGKDSLALWDILDASRVRRHRLLPRPRDRRLLQPVQGSVSISFAESQGAKLIVRSLETRSTASPFPNCRRLTGPGPLLGLRIEQTLRVQPGRARGGLRRPRHRSQPRRRGRDTVRKRAALEHRHAGPSDAGSRGTASSATGTMRASPWCARRSRS